MSSDPQIQTSPSIPRNDLCSWKRLEQHAAELASVHIRDLFAGDPERAARFSVCEDSFILDYSKNRITPETIGLLCDLARECGLEDLRDQMFSGAPINSTEERSVLHTALRGSADPSIEIEGINVADDVAQTLERMEAFCRAVDEENRITDIVNIGIGGSDIGPHLVYNGLKVFARADRRAHFLSNVDPSAITEILDELDPETTLFIVCSKSFTTQETMTNAATAKAWLVDRLGTEKVAKHFTCVTGNKDAAIDFGIDADYIFPLRNWVGGRYSLWSAIGLPVALTIGFENFKNLLAGAAQADAHFKTQPLEKNIPVLMGLMGVWYRNFLGCDTYAILPYNHYLRAFPRYIQQIDMESNGKAVDRNGVRVSYGTAPVIFGDVGTNGQHAFHQHLHQGTQIVPCDFIAFAKAQKSSGDHQDKLLANALAQAEALMLGAENKGEPHRNFGGNRPSNFILLESLTPYSLGLLMGFYEHKTFAQGAIWNLNSFDQYGVELGKRLSGEILDSLKKGQSKNFDSSTQSLIEKINSF